MVEVLISPDKPRFQFLERKLSILRDENTQREEFRTTADRLFRNLGAYLSESLPTTATEAVTPTRTAYQRETTDSSGVLLVSILRSGLPMVQGIADALPDAEIAMVDMKRVEVKDEASGKNTCKPRQDYDGLPKDLSKVKRFKLPDPMIATGGSTIESIGMLIKNGAKESSIHVIGLVAAAEGILEIRKKYPKVKITTCALDDGLNDVNYIVPGLGDFGDRYFHPNMIVIDRKAKRKLYYIDKKIDHCEDITNEELEELGSINYIDVPLAA
jgi:uracil phosphoribosyltransferase